MAEPAEAAALRGTVEDEGTDAAPRASRPALESRRDRQRIATAAEIRLAARRQLSDAGPQGVSLRGIAREMGMTAPGLYRYFESLDDLLEGMCEDYFREVNDAVAGALADAGPDLGVRMHAAIRAFRRWAVAHPAEFGLMFRDRGVVFGPQDTCEHSRRFAGLFLGLFVQMWHQQPFDLPVGLVVPPAARAQLDAYARLHDLGLPEQALWVFASSWVRLYGVICMEVFGQLTFMFSDVEPYFEAELAAVVAAVGVRYLPLDVPA